MIVAETVQEIVELRKQKTTLKDIREQKNVISQYSFLN